MSFNNLMKWKENFISHANPEHASSYPFILVGNKNDMEDERAVTSAQIEEFVREYNITAYYETSAKENAETENPASTKIVDLFEGTC